MKSLAAAQRLRDEVEALQWYHTLELAPGLETPGWFDLRPILDDFPLPTSLEGKRCLDIGTFDGFWAFELERRGASEVVAIDINDPIAWDWPAGSRPETISEIARRKAGGQGFDLARRALGSKVERRELSVYDLDPNEIGQFDLVYLGSLLLHLRDPVRGLMQAGAVCRGTLVVCDAIDRWASRVHRRPLASLDGVDRPWWWKPNEAGLVRMVEAAGLTPVTRLRHVRMPSGAGQGAPPLRPSVLASRAGRERLAHAWRGDPHGVVVARPQQT